jgi:hypothetical protein
MEIENLGDIDKKKLHTWDPHLIDTGQQPNTCIWSQQLLDPFHKRCLVTWICHDPEEFTASFMFRL